MLYLLPEFIIFEFLIARAFWIMAFCAECFSFCMNDQPVFNCFILIFHNGELFIFRTGAVACFALNAVFFIETAFQLCRIDFFAQNMTFQTLRGFCRRSCKSLILGYLIGFRSLKRLVCL